MCAQRRRNRRPRIREGAINKFRERQLQSRGISETPPTSYSEPRDTFEHNDSFHAQQHKEDNMNEYISNLTTEALSCTDIERCNNIYDELVHMLSERGIAESNLTEYQIMKARGALKNIIYNELMQRELLKLYFFRNMWMEPPESYKPELDLEQFRAFVKKHVKHLPKYLSNPKKIIIPGKCTPPDSATVCIARVKTNIPVLGPSIIYIHENEDNIPSDNISDVNNASAPNVRSFSFTPTPEQYENYRETPNVRSFSFTPTPEQYETYYENNLSDVNLSIKEFGSSLNISNFRADSKPDVNPIQSNQYQEYTKECFALTKSHPYFHIFYESDGKPLKKSEIRKNLKREILKIISQSPSEKISKNILQENGYGSFTNLFGRNDLPIKMKWSELLELIGQNSGESEQNYQKETLLKFLNSKKKEIAEGSFIPTKENIISNVPFLADYSNLNNILYKWFKRNTRFGSLSELKESVYGISDTQKLYSFLESKQNDILNGRFIPSKMNIIKENPELSKFGEINNKIAKWLKRNTPFSGVKDIRNHFKGKPEFTQITEYLDSIKTDILKGKIIPDTKFLRKVKPDLEKDPNSHIAVLRWIKSNTPFDSLSDLREHFKGIPISTKLWQFLDNKKKQILNGELVPDSATISTENNIFKGYGTLSLIVNEWLKQNTSFDSLTDYKEFFFGIPIPTQIENFLNTKKREILEGKFIPTKMNLCDYNSIFCDYSHINDVANRWLKNNSNFNSLSELKEHFKADRYQLRPSTQADKVWKFLDKRKDNIFRGKFFPTVKNMRTEDVSLGNYKYLSKEVAKWLDDRSNGEFPTIGSLIEFFDPFPNELGQVGHHNYTPNFENERFRVLNAVYQIVKIVDDNDLMVLANKNKNFRTWDSVIHFLETNEDWNMVDLLSGEIIKLDDVKKENYAFHHIDRNKQNDSLDNLVYLLRHNHGVITAAQMYFPQLERFFVKVLKNNSDKLKDGEIPESWKSNWRVIAIDKGFKLPLNRYKFRKTNRNVLN